MYVFARRCSLPSKVSKQRIRHRAAEDIGLKIGGNDKPASIKLSPSSRTPFPSPTEPHNSAST